jgi:hypothetical protein
MEYPDSSEVPDDLPTGGVHLSEPHGTGYSKMDPSRYGTGFFPSSKILELHLPNGKDLFLLAV